MLTIDNHGPLIVSSSYWGSDLDAGGKVWISVNACAIRLLVPQTQRHIIEDMRTAKYVICSRGPWPAGGKADAVELLFEDFSDSPFSLHVGPESVDNFPGDPSPQNWVFSAWDLKKNMAHKAVERPCFWRRVPSLPWLKPWK